MKSKLVSNIFLTFIWVALTGDFSFENYLFGFIVSFFIMLLITFKRNRSRYFIIVPKLILLFLNFIYELIKANLEVAYEAPRSSAESGFGGPSYDPKEGGL